MKTLYIVRGVSGSGKTTFAESICDHVYAADDYFMVNGEYKFDMSKRALAHQSCQRRVENGMISGHDKIAVANTFTQKWEFAIYQEMAKKYGYRCFVVIVENRHGNSNVHDVPEEALSKQEERFEVKLR